MREEEELGMPLDKVIAEVIAALKSGRRAARSPRKRRLIRWGGDCRTARAESRSFDLTSSNRTPQPV
jgi:hypothetical protein